MLRLLPLLGVLVAPSVFAFAGAGSIPQGYVFPGYSGPGSHAFVPSGEAKFWNGVARTTGFVDAAGKTAATSAIISRVAGAGRYVWAACYANPIICAGGVAFAAYMMQSGIEQDPESGQWGKWKGGQNGMEYGYGDNWFSTLEAAASSFGASISTGGYTYTLQACSHPPDGSPSCNFTVIREGFNPYTDQFSFSYRPSAIPRYFEPVTQEQLEQHFSQYEPSDDAANEAGAAGVPMPTAQPQMAPTRSPVGEPYKNAQGQTRQDVMDCVHNPQTMAPLAFECTMKSVDPATTSTTTHPDLGSSPAAPPGSASSPTGTPTPPQPEEKPSDLCALHPDIVACAKFGTVPEQQPIPKKVTPVNFVSESLGLPAACPAPIALPRGATLEFTSACDAFRMLRPFVVALGAVVSMMMVVFALRVG